METNSSENNVIAEGCIEGAVLGEEEFEVEEILRYRKSAEGDEAFFVKWVGYPASEATWEPLAHMNENCRELIARARVVFAWRRPQTGTSQSASTVQEVIVGSAEVHAEDAQPNAADAVDPGVNGAEESMTDEQVLVDGVASDGNGAELDIVPEEVGDSVTQDDRHEISWESAARTDGATPSPLPAASAHREIIREPSFESGQPPIRNLSSTVLGSVDGGIVVDDVDDEDTFDGFDVGQTKRGGQNGVDATSALAGAPAKRLKLQSPALSRSGTQGPTESGPVSSQPKRTTSASPAAPPSGARHIPTPKPSPPPPPTGGPSSGQEFDVTEPAPVVKRPIPREMKCICGVSEKLSNTNRDRLVVCRICSCAAHPGCVQGAINGKFPEEYVCPPCRLERVDEFHPPVGLGLLRHSYASDSSTFTLSFEANTYQWKSQQWAVHLRSCALSTTDLTGPAWPHRVQGKLNGRQCVAIDPPKHLHVRREQCYNLTPLLRQGINQLELRFHPKPDRLRDDPEEGFCVGVVLTRPRSVVSIVGKIRARSTETVSSGQHRVRRLIAQVRRKERNEEECTVTGNFGRTLRPICPMSLCPIEEAAIGRHCNHVQVFDLHSYVSVNQRMRSLDKRWACPVCSLALRPDDVVLDPFAQGILDTLQGDEDLVDAVVFNEDCTWSTVSAVKEKEGKEGRPAEDEGIDGEEKGSAELIDLSDSE